MKEMDMIVLRRPLPEHNLEAGDIGTVVYVYENEKAVEVEFVTGEGSTVAVVTLSLNDVRSLGQKEILHVRDLLAA